MIGHRRERSIRGYRSSPCGLVLQATDRQHQVGIGQQAVQEDRLPVAHWRPGRPGPGGWPGRGSAAASAGPRTPSSRRQGSPRRRPRQPWSAARRCRPARTPAADQGVDHRGRDLGRPRQSLPQRHDDPVARSRALPQGRIVQRLLQGRGHSRRQIRQRRPLRLAAQVRSRAVGRFEAGPKSRCRNARQSLRKTAQTGQLSQVAAALLPLSADSAARQEVELYRKGRVANNGRLPPIPATRLYHGP